MKNGIKKLALLLLSFSISYADLVTVEGDVTTDVVWTADNTYYLNNQAFVKDGVTLTIEAGTEIVGRYDANYSADNPAPCLVVEQGGKVMAQGTVDAPITFRSELSEDDPNYGNGRGLWGGLIINGYAPIANEGGTAAVEGLTGVLYGGSDPDDNSGVLRYVRVWNGGSSIAPDNEINGITLAGVGRGTTVEYCEVALNLDDGFEMFGGTVDLKYCSAVSVGDDAFDTDAGYQGRGQFLLVVRADDSDKGHEMDSKTNGDLDSQPRSHPHFANVTVISSVAHGEDALRLREGTGGDFRNYIIHGANDGVRNDENGSEVVTQDLAEAAAAGHPDFLYISGSMVMNGLADVPWDDFDEETDGPWTGTYVMESAGLTYTVDANGLPATLDVTPPMNGVAYQDVDTVIEDDFFVQTDYKGAFSSDENWLDGWSYLSEAGLLLSADNNPSTIVADKITLHGNYPNPFNPSTTLQYDLNKGGLVNITIYDMLGNTINELVNEVQNSGYKSIQWNATNNQGEPVSAGVYLYKIQAGDFVDTKKMILSK
ncbi:T9SS type A sorting domain-containing protein [Candidatus Marinimicrobia bacterium]|nr:T9SS type A sorting domain-containing protein [Candidatus Neomarinimicrobiota bacterium]